VLYTYDKQDTGDTRITGANDSFRYQQWMYGPYAALKFSFSSRRERMSANSTHEIR